MATTINLNANIETRKKLVGIAKTVTRKSVSGAFSAGSTILSTEKEIRDTKRASVLIPFMQGAKKVSDVIAEGMAGAVSATQALVGERIVTLANELITNPIGWRPRDGEVINANELLARYKDGFSVTAVVIKDRNYFRTITSKGVAGLSTGEKAQVVNTDATLHDTNLTLEERGKLFVQQIREEKVKLMQFTDQVVQGDFVQSDLILGLSGTAELAVQNDARYNIRTDVAVKDTGSLRPADAMFDGHIETHVSKVFAEEKLDAVLMIKGVATSLFLFKDFMNNDKVAGINLYKLSLEFNEGTGVFVPQLITLFAKSADAPAQNRVGSGSLDIMANVEQSDTTSTNPTVTANVSN